jgi:isochorismate synthase
LNGILAYQRPGSSKIISHYGNWTTFSTDEISQILNGFIFVDFLQEKIYLFIPNESFDWNAEELKYTPISDENNHQIEYTKEKYIEKCTHFIKKCQEGQNYENGIQKLVLSRVKKVPLPTDFSINTYFTDVCSAYTHSFNYFIHIQNQCTWIGATPEELIVEHPTHFTTVSLAGTRAISDSNPFAEKEREEQAIVTDYIKNVLTKKGAQFTVPENASEVIAGNLRHLKSIFKIDKTLSALTLAKVLHPTPAICGFPKQEAQDFIIKNEGFNRKFYSGFLGMISPKENYIYVNLRCAELYTSTINIHVGGGITSSSIAEKEWEETEHKSQTLLRFLNTNRE